MKKFTDDLKAFWEKVKAFMLKEWFGLKILWWFLIGLVLTVVSVFLFFGRSKGKLKKSKAK